MVSDVWKRAQDYLKATLPVDDYDLWVAPVRAKSLESGLLTMEVPGRLHADWFEKNVKKRLLDILTPENSGIMEMNFVWIENASTKNAAAPPVWRFESAPQAGIPQGLACFNPKYTFERFVIGPTSRFAHASSLAVAQNPGKQFNPLFIYGHTGLGKTHLLHAIGHLLSKNNPRLSVLYINAETFVNDYVNSLKNRSADALRDRYRKVDCFLMDDVQFLIGKEHSEQEFFHTFNTLFETSRQIVMTSDRPPKDLQPVESRLISRFEWGVVADIQPPDFETRLAILRNKIDLDRVPVPDEILQRLAQNIRSNIRALEGCLNSLIAFCGLTGSPMTMETADQILKQMREDAPKDSGMAPSIAKIQEVVSHHYHVTIDDLKDKSRSASKVLPRQVAMYLARSLTGRSLEEIGRAFGGKDHSTVMHATSKIEAMVRTDPYMSQFINKLEEEINKEAVL